MRLLIPSFCLRLAVVELPKSLILCGSHAGSGPRAIHGQGVGGRGMGEGGGEVDKGRGGG